jgi:hypothetical protein
VAFKTAEVQVSVVGPAIAVIAIVAVIGIIIISARVIGVAERAIDRRGNSPASTQSGKYQ